MFDLFTTIDRERAKQLSPLTLAFVGDAVYSLYVREREVIALDSKLNELQKRTAAAVSAKGQSDLLLKTEELFTAEEEEIYHRGRNAKKSTKSKNASVTDYNRSTGFEAVLGYLYLTGQYARIAQLAEGAKVEN